MGSRIKIVGPKGAAVTPTPRKHYGLTYRCRFAGRISALSGSGVLLITTVDLKGNEFLTIIYIRGVEGLQF